MLQIVIIETAKSVSAGISYPPAQSLPSKHLTYSYLKLSWMMQIGTLSQVDASIISVDAVSMFGPQLPGSDKTIITYDAEWHCPKISRLADESSEVDYPVLFRMHTAVRWLIPVGC